MQKKKAILLVNLGSPDSPAPGDVYRYLTEFLNDPRVIDISWLGRKALVNGIIVPFRHRNSARLYQKLWTENGSPLIHYGHLVQEKLQKRHDPSATRIFLAMRYQNPSITSALAAIRKWNPDSLVVLPLFPQYASASTGSVFQKIMEELSHDWVIPETRFIAQFYDHPLFAKAFADRARSLDWRSFDHVLFSYHGLPERHLDKVYDGKLCVDHQCEQAVDDDNKFCYKATCYETTRLIAAELGMSHDHYTVCFQSRLGRGWVEPFSDEVIRDKARTGTKRILVFSPAFVADCLETTIEIGDEYSELFLKNGGEHLQLVPSLNDSELWIECLQQLTA